VAGQGDGVDIVLVNELRERDCDPSANIATQGANMTMERKEGFERRKYKRYHHPAKAMICWGLEGRCVSGSIVDLSTGGCLVRLEVENDLKVGETVEIQLESSYLAFQAFGLIRRTEQHGCLLGISFQRVSKRGLVDRKMQNEGVAEAVEDRRKERVKEPVTV
jgi:hypothetical protein